MIFTTGSTSLPRNDPRGSFLDSATRPLRRFLLPLPYGRGTDRSVLVVRSWEPLPNGQGERLTEQVIEVDPLIGTGAVYPGQTVLADLTTDLINDGPASNTGAREDSRTSGAGEILATWTKDSDEHIIDPGNPNVAIGSAAVVSGYRESDIANILINETAFDDLLSNSIGKRPAPGAAYGGYPSNAGTVAADCQSQR